MKETVASLHVCSGLLLYKLHEDKHVWGKHEIKYTFLLNAGKR